MIEDVSFYGRVSYAYEYHEYQCYSNWLVFVNITSALHGVGRTQGHPDRAVSMVD